METYLKIKHLAPYLPYGLKIRNFRKEEYLFIEDIILNGEVLDYILIECNLVYHSYKPILRPLSDLTKEIEHSGEKFIPEYLFTETFGSNDDTLIENMNDENNELHFSVCKDLPYYVIEWLLSLHFDIFGLIEKGLAIDINTIEKG